MGGNYCFELLSSFSVPTCTLFGILNRPVLNLLVISFSLPWCLMNNVLPKWLFKVCDVGIVHSKSVLRMIVTNSS